MSNLILSAPANDGAVTRSHRINTRASANAIGYAANASKKIAYGPESSAPDRASARINALPRLARRLRERLLHRRDTVDPGGFVRLRQQIEDLDDVRIDIEISR